MGRPEHSFSCKLNGFSPLEILVIYSKKLEFNVALSNVDSCIPITKILEEVIDLLSISTRNSLRSLFHLAPNRVL